LKREPKLRLPDLLGIPFFIFVLAEPVLPPPAREDTVRAVQETFSDPELAAGCESTHEPTLGILAFVVNLLGEFFEGLVHTLKSLHVSYPVLYWGLLVFLFLLLIALIIHIAWTFSLAFRGLPSNAAAEASRSERVRRFLEIREQARSLAGEGRYKEAVRELLLALITLVEEKRIVSVARGWTIREIVSRVAQRTGAARPLGIIERRFEDVWYGGEDITEAQFAACDGSLDSFVRELSTTHREGAAAPGWTSS
jgi:hypothetical protein